MRGVLASLVALLLTAPLFAEVSVAPNGKLRLPGDDSSIWAPAPGGHPFRQLLNPPGDFHGDGAPSVAISPLTEKPEVVWSQAGQVNNLQFARWTGGMWRIVPVIDSGSDDVEPILDHDSEGNRFVVWQSGGALLLSGAPWDSPEFKAPVQLSEEGSTVLESDLLVLDSGDLYVAWIELSGSQVTVQYAYVSPEQDWSWILRGGGEIPIPIPDRAGVISTIAFVPGSSVRTLEISLSSEDGVIWVGWIDGVHLRFASLTDGVLGAIHEIEILNGRNALERAREGARRIVLEQSQASLR